MVNYSLYNFLNLERRPNYSAIDGANALRLVLPHKSGCRRTIPCFGPSESKQNRRQSPMFSFSRMRFFAFQLGLLTLTPALAWPQGIYTSSFPNTENPISQGGLWVGGQSAGGNLWGNIQTTLGFAFGVTQPTQFGDPTAILTGTWGANQSVSATVKIVSAQNNTHEVEVRLRTTISANSITGYEVYCSTKSGDPYCHIARWNGPNGSYCNIESSTPLIYLADGDVLTGMVSGTNPVTITGYKNGVQILQAQDRGGHCSPGGPGGPFTSGNPGIGFYDGGDNYWNTFGFSSFSTTDGLTTATFTTSVAPSSQTVTQGNSAAYTVTVAPSGGFTGTITLSASGQPAGATASFSPSSITTSGSATLTVSTLSSTPAASYPLAITGTSGSTTQTASATLVVKRRGRCRFCRASVPAR